MTERSEVSTARQSHLYVIWVTMGLLVVIVLAFAWMRVLIDWPHIIAGTWADDDFATRYIEHPVDAYLHIVPGVIYLLGAPLQLSRRFRTRHYATHRRLGRILIVCAMTSGVFALLFGITFPFGGNVEAVATGVFGSWFLLCLSLALLAIRRHDVRNHRRWMIRAFAIGLGVGTIRLWVGAFRGLELLSLEHAFAASFWIAFAIHALAAEWWLRCTPGRSGCGAQPMDRTVNV